MRKKKLCSFLLAAAMTCSTFVAVPATEATVTKQAGMTVYDASETEENYLLGDINNDTKINLADVQHALRAYVGLDNLTETEKLSADINKDGEVTLADAQYILKCYLKMVENIETYAGTPDIPTNAEPTLSYTDNGDGTISVTLSASGNLSLFDYGIVYDSEKVSVYESDIQFSSDLSDLSDCPVMTKNVADNYAILAGVLPEDEVSYEGVVATITFRKKGVTWGEISVVKDSVKAFKDKTDLSEVEKDYVIEDDYKEPEPTPTPTPTPNPWDNMAHGSTIAVATSIPYQTPTPVESAKPDNTVLPAVSDNPTETTDTPASTVPIVSEQPGEATGNAIKAGDANGDEKIDLSDAQMILRVYLKIITQDKVVGNGDANGDGKVDLTDAQLVLRYYLKIITDFTEQSESEYEDFVVTEDNIYMFGESLDDGKLVIPETFTYQGVNYRTVSIGWNAFDYCDGLTSVTLPDSLESVGGFAFSDCNLTSITVPEKTTGIGDEAFSGNTNLRSVTISKNIQYIGFNAFYWCKSLTDVYFDGTKEDRDKIDIDDDGNDSLLNATWHYAE